MLHKVPHTLGLASIVLVLLVPPAAADNAANYEASSGSCTVAGIDLGVGCSVDHSGTVSVALLDCSLVDCVLRIGGDALGNALAPGQLVLESHLDTNAVDAQVCADAAALATLVACQGAGDGVQLASAGECTPFSVQTTLVYNGVFQAGVQNGFELCRDLLGVPTIVPAA